MKKRTWHSGPPPHIGWWNASDARKSRLWRWWNGEYWSVGVYKSALPVIAGSAAQYREGPSFPIEWTKYYPKRARVPRIKP